MNIAPGGSFVVGRALQAAFIVDGAVTGANQISIPFGASNFFARGGVTA